MNVKSTGNVIRIEIGYSTDVISSSITKAEDLANSLLDEAQYLRTLEKKNESDTD